MAKKEIKLDENTLKQIIMETIEEIVNEEELNDFTPIDPDMNLGIESIY